MTEGSVAGVGMHSGHEKVSLARVIHSEWIKFRSLRSTWISIAAALVAAIGLGILFSALRASHFATAGQGPHASHAVLHGGLDPTMISLRGLFLAQLAIGVLGVLLITGEYATGMIRGSLTAVPARHPVLVGKAIVFGAATFVIATAASLVAFLGGQAALNTQHLGVSLSSPGAARAVLGGGLYLMIVGLLGLGCGFLIRSTGGAIAALFGLILVLPLLANALPTSWQNDVSPYLPLNAGSALMSTVAKAHALSPWAGGAVFAAYALVALGFGLLVLLRRDA
ncbi:MAG: ABC transporter permease subunit [Mycobacteriales bacterium]